MKEIRVLIVDDDPMFVNFVRRVLDSLSYSPALSASNGGEALTLLNSHRFDVVLLDIELGASEDGFEIYDKIRDEFDIPVVFVTARPEESVASRIDPGSVHGLLFKPVRPTELDVAIMAAVRNRNAELALRERHSDLNDVVSHATDSVLVVDQSGVIELASGAFLEWTDAEESNVRERSIYDFLEDWKLSRRGGSGRARLRLSSGQSVAVEVHAFPLKGGRYEILIPRRESEEEQKLTLISKVFDTMVEGVFILDAKRSFIYANRSLLKMLGYKWHEIDGRPGHIISSRRYGIRFVAAVWGALKRTGRWEGAVFLSGQDGSERNEWINLTAVRQEGRIEHLVGLVLEATERRRHEEMLFFMAHHDFLTGLANRSYFHEHLHRSLMKARRTGTKAAVFFIDLDGFKKINDSLGHQAGDETLRVVSRRLRESLRKTDVVGRYGGDEFTAFIDDLQDYEQSFKVADKISHAINGELLVKNQMVKVGASIGISLFPKEGERVDELMQLADAAMYLAKRSGGYGYRFSDREMDGLAAHWREYRIQLQQQIRDRPLQFQLVRDRATNRVFAVEPNLDARDLAGGPSQHQAATGADGYRRILAFLREEASPALLSLLSGRRILLRISAALAGNDGLWDLLVELRHHNCRPLLEISESELEKLLAYRGSTLERLLEDEPTFAIREPTGAVVHLPEYRRLPLECLVLSIEDGFEGSEDRRLLASTVQNNARMLGLSVLFDSIPDADVLEEMGAGSGDLFRGPLAGDHLEAKDLEHLLKK